MRKPHTGKQLQDFIVKEIREGHDRISIAAMDDEYKILLKEGLADHPLFEAFGFEWCDRLVQVHDFIEVIHEHQIINNISGLEWLKLEWDGSVLVTPHALPNLVVLPRDFGVVREWKSRIQKQWLKAIGDRDVWRYQYNAARGQYPSKKSSKEQSVLEVLKADWAFLALSKEGSDKDLILTVISGDMGSPSVTKSDFTISA